MGQFRSEETVGNVPSGGDTAVAHWCLKDGLGEAALPHRDGYRV